MSELVSISDGTVENLPLEDVVEFIRAVTFLKARGYTIIPPEVGRPEGTVFSDIVGL